MGRSNATQDKVKFKTFIDMEKGAKIVSSTIRIYGDHQLH